MTLIPLHFTKYLRGRVCVCLELLCVKSSQEQVVTHRCCLVAQACLIHGNPMDCSLPGSSIHAILQARILEWAAISFSRGIFPTQGSNPCLLHWQVDSLPLSHVRSKISCCRKQNVPFLKLLCEVFWLNHNMD